jgi:uncharacterized Ntn-hydrolase superfamily protein
MKKTLLSLTFTLSFISAAFAQDTFSIVAVDSTTREVGSAGASCVDLFAFNLPDPSFIGDLIPNTGAINTQSYYLASNQTNARNRMLAGDTPTQIINWLETNDAESNPMVRQYGIAGFNGQNASSAAYTGANCFDYKNHKTGNIAGFYYAIQGNILSGQHIIDSMEYKFRNAPGNLACRLMAALQGANQVGADSRCAGNSTSSLFAYLKVAQPNDLISAPSFNIGVKTEDGQQIEPIDSLQVIFNLQNNCNLSFINNTFSDRYITVFPNPSNGFFTISLPVDEAQIIVMDMLGHVILQTETNQKMEHIKIENSGVYMLSIITKDAAAMRKVIVSQE